MNRSNAERLRRLLSAAGTASGDRRIFSRGPFVYIPLAGKPGTREASAITRLGGSVVDADFRTRERRPSYRELIEGTGAGDALRSKGYDLLGGIAVIEAPASAARRAAAALMRSNGSVRTVLRKGGAVAGRYRTRKLHHVLGERNFIADYAEAGCRFVFDVRKVFFSGRLAYERQRINRLVKSGESVVVMFAGVGPYAIEIAKSHPDCRVVAMELNHAACEYLRENVRINRVGNVTVEEGDVRRLAAKYEGFADRIVMPLPKTSSSFLNEALRVAKRRCTVHYYTFCRSGREDVAVARIKDFFELKGAGFRPLNTRTARPYSAAEAEIVVDFLIHKT